MKTLLKTSIVVAAVLAVLSCAPKSTASYMDHKPVCMGVELDGSHTLKSWGFGRNRADAIEQAKKNAVREIIFNGSREGRQGCKYKPLVFEVNAEEKYESYFNNFFADGGPFLEFISMRDERISNKLDRDGTRQKEGVVYSTVVRVLRSKLETRLKQDGIIK
ncbi:MAG TPA: hypothetical protein VFF21_03320 [Flavobacteriaceae bacterium]|nr:hypothetical protein [Flavobacteriaceae bacterium]